MSNTKYLDPSLNKPRLIGLIEVIFGAVLDGGGDGYGMWFSTSYSVKDIKEFIIDNDLLPTFWKIKDYTPETIHISYDQEGLTITNDPHVFDGRNPYCDIVVQY